MADLNLDRIEQSALDILNASIGLFKTVSNEVTDFQKKITDGYDELVAKGSTDSSETVEAIRSQLDASINGIKDIQGKVEGALNLKTEEIAKPVSAPKAAPKKAKAAAPAATATA